MMHSIRFSPRHVAATARALVSSAILLPVAAGLALAAGMAAPPAARSEVRCATHQPGMPGVADLVESPRARDPGLTPAGPPPDPGLGDSWTWYTWKLNGPPTPDPRSCTVRGVGVNCYVVVEDTQWNVNVNQADVDAIVARFDDFSVGAWPDEGIWDLDTSTFGMPPDPLDNDPRIYILWYDFDIAADGFFWAFDQFPDGTQPYASNECEVVYMNCSDRDPGSDYMISIIGHEFEHLIHFARDEDEVAWVDEGIAEYAMYLFGEPDPLGSFAANPDNDLTMWSGAFSDYIQSYLYMLYLHEHLGGRPMLTTLINEPANNTAGITNALATAGHAETYLEVFRRWVVANYLDDTTIGDGRYGYYGEDLPHFNGRRHSTYPVSPPTTSVNHWAGDYIVFADAYPALDMTVNGADTGQFDAFVLEMGSAPTAVREVTLNASQEGALTVYGFEAATDSAVLVVANVTPAGLTTYAYTGALNPATSVATSPPAGAASLQTVVSPNPARAGASGAVVTIDLAVPATAVAHVAVIGPDGRLVRTLFEGTLAAGHRPLAWDGRDAQGRAAAPGVYWVRAECAGQRAAASLVLVK